MPPAGRYSAACTLSDQWAERAAPVLLCCRRTHTEHATQHRATQHSTADTAKHCPAQQLSCARDEVMSRLHLWRRQAFCFPWSSDVTGVTVSTNEVHWRPREIGEVTWSLNPCQASTLHPGSIAKQGSLSYRTRRWSACQPAARAWLVSLPTTTTH